MGSLFSRWPDPSLLNECRKLVLRVIRHKEARHELLRCSNGDDIQVIIDCLDHILINLDMVDDDLGELDRHSLLHLLVKLAKKTNQFPKRLYLPDMRRFDQRRKQVDDDAGSSGFIYRVSYKNKSVCVKVLRLHGNESKRQKRRQAAAKEIILLAHMLHQNVMSLCGIIEVKGGDETRICPVLPWMENGNLLKHLEKFPQSARMMLLHDITSGLEYLHQHSIVHSDLKAMNVLVSQQIRAILTDFGISRFHATDLTSTSSGDSGTIRWMAPELVAEDGTIRTTKESDIWAFGCTCFEVLMGKPPFPHIKGYNGIRKALSETPVIPGEIEQDEMERWSEENLRKAWELAQSCWRDPRPTARDLNLKMRKLHHPHSKTASNASLESRKATKPLDFEKVHAILCQIQLSTIATSLIEIPNQPTVPTEPTLGSSLTRVARRIGSLDRDRLTAFYRRFVQDVTRTGEDGSVSRPTLCAAQEITTVTAVVPSIGRVTMIDTPGIDYNKGSTENDLFNEIATWLSDKYGDAQLEGVIYMYPIWGSELPTRSPFAEGDSLRKMCGRDWRRKVMFVTTCWDELHQYDGEMKEGRLKEGYWREMLNKGSSLGRYEKIGDHNGAVKIVEKLLA
ncbi:hypothetical protein AN958_08895 [Leucoagaricus sp. SymC.cos]|nr:hypothetical protein AN958_08895 [Leucoagaricus sp. SymC.cos]